MSTNHMQALIYSVNAMKRALHPPPKLVRMLPSVFVENDGKDYPGCAEANARARHYATAHGIELKVYDGIGPDVDGSEV